MTVYARICRQIKSIYRSAYFAYLAIALLSAVTAFLLYRNASPYLLETDLRMKDARQRLCSIRKPDSRVAIVAIDNRSIKEHGRWPWPREEIARLISEVAGAGARIIALDIVFAEPQSGASDKYLERAISAKGNVVSGYFFRDEQNEPGEDTHALLIASRIRQFRQDPGSSLSTVPSFPHVDANITPVARAAIGQGFFNQMPDRDGIYRSIPLLLRYQENIYPSLVLAGISHFLGYPPVIEAAPLGVSAVTMGPVRIPTSDAGQMPLAYYGPGGTVQTFSAAELLSGRLAEGELRGKLVFIGVTETGVADLHATPLDPALPAVELLATATANILEERFVIRDSRTYAIDLAFLLIFPFMMAASLCSVRGIISSLGILGLSGAVHLLLNYGLFAYCQYDLSIVYPGISILTTYLGSESYRNLVLDRRSRYLRRAFSAYVSPDLVEQLIRHPENLKLGGTRREVTIIFTDIRSFTTISERIGPENVITLLNRYLAPMTNIVMESRGTLVQYIGDAIMALFNAPLDNPLHAACACECALKMMRRLQLLNKELQEIGLPQIEIGIGINSGDAIVGNMGADYRFQYSAVGDAVNLASRLEGLNKYYGTQILVNQSTRMAAGDNFVFREVDSIRVKGKEVAVTIYELLAEPTAMLVEFDAALVKYRERRFDEALEDFTKIAATGDRVAQVYAERCREYLITPPEEGWDGVFLAPGK